MATGLRQGFVPSSASVEEVARTCIWGFGAPLPLPRGPGVTLHRAPNGVASPPHAASLAGVPLHSPLLARPPPRPQLPSNGGRSVFRMHFCRFRSGLCAFLDHCSWGSASCHHPGRRVSRGRRDSGGLRRERPEGADGTGASLGAGVGGDKSEVKIGKG